MESPTSPPNSEPYDPGSSVSSNMMEEYEDLLRYAVVTPSFSGSVLTPNLKATLSNRSATPKTTTTPAIPTTPTVTTRATRLSDIPSSDEEVHEVRRQQLSTATPSTSAESTMNIVNSSLRKQTVVPKTRSDTIKLRMPAASSTALESSLRVTRTGEDEDVTRLGSQLDSWCSELKSNVLAEFIQSKLRLKEKCNKDMQTEREQHTRSLHDAIEDSQRKLELLRTYESSISKKDEVIGSLTKSLHKQKEQVKLARTFSAWKFCYMDKKREAFTEKLAIKHCDQKLKSRVIRSWFGIIQGRWKQRVEKACQLRAEEVCHGVTNEYEGKLAALHHSYEDALGEISVLRKAQTAYEDNMKKAFMRGVCALNMEAMTMFNDPSRNGGNHRDDGVAHSCSRDDVESVCSSQQPSLPPDNPPNCRRLNVKLSKPEKKGSKKLRQPFVSVERHVPK